MTAPSLTPHQSQYIAWQLTRRAASNSMKSLASPLVDSQMNLNPWNCTASGAGVIQHGMGAGMSGHMLCNSQISTCAIEGSK